MAQMFQNILLPLDGSPISERAVEHALELASLYGAQLHLLRVRLLPPKLLELGETAALKALREQETESCQGYLEAWRDKLSGQVDTAIHHEPGAPAEVILAASRALPECLIVMASRGHDGLERWLLGSVAERVVRHSEVPVMLVRGEAN